MLLESDLDLERRVLTLLSFALICYHALQLLVSLGIFLLELIFLRETRGSVVLTRKAKKLRKEHKDDRYRAAAELETPDLKALLHASTTRAAMLLVKEPVVLFFSLW